MYRLFAILLLVSFSIIAQKQITIDDFALKNTFAQKSVSGINWMKDGKFYTMATVMTMCIFKILLP